ncbi:hypothetical protein [Streptomyces showdoensis]|nr:hypothetical protein [Streptomyces showdoensis]
MADEAPITSICGCGQPIVVPPHTPSELPKQPRHIGIPGEPTECPK